MIQPVIPYTKNFTKEILFGRLKSVDEDPRKSRDLWRVKIAFSALNIWPNLTRSASIDGDFASSRRSNEDKNIEEGIGLFVRRGKNRKKIFKCWTLNEFRHYASKFPKREKKYKWKFKPRRDRNRNFLYENED